VPLVILAGFLTKSNISISKSPPKEFDPNMFFQGPLFFEISSHVHQKSDM
jgi:hypothetical protein